MARLEVTNAAVEDLARLIRSHSLPANTPARFRRSLEPLATFPMIGAELGGRWKGFRFVLGPWRWMIAVYVLLDDDRVVVVTVQDGRTAASPGVER